MGTGYQKLCIADKAIHQNIDFLQKLCVADSNQESAHIICTHPAFTDTMLIADPPSHGSAAFGAADISTQEVDCLTVRFTGVALSGSF
jgi:hypothetical protein